MNMQAGMFDPNQYEPATGSAGQLPVSDANGLIVVITQAIVKPTSAGDGTLLELTLQTQDGQTGVHRLNLGNQNPKAVEIACRELSAICICLNVTQAFNYQQDCSILLNKQFRVVVGIQKGENGTEKGYTEIKKFLRLDGSKPTRGGSTQSSPPAQAAMPQVAPVQPAQAQPGMPMQQPVMPQAQLVAQPAMPQAPAQPMQQLQPQPQPQPVQNPAAMPWAQNPPQG